jgi:type IV pilus assembly protein PilQ
MKKLTVLLFFLGLFQIANAQIDLRDKLRGFVNPEEIVTLSETMPFDQAIGVLSNVSEKIAGKKVVLGTQTNKPIGIEIDKMQYKKALYVIALYNNLVVDESETTLLVRKKEDSKEKLDKVTYASVGEREVKISALLFEGDVDEMHQRGVNWEFLLSQPGLNIGSNLVTMQPQLISNTTIAIPTAGGSSSSGATTTQVSPTYNLDANSKYTLGHFDGTATGLFQFLETENLGKIISRPTISVVSGVAGRTQVGTDFSIKEKDFSGNLTDRFFSTGTIIEVTPYIYNEDDIQYVYLKLKVERSSATPGALSTEIQKTVATTNVLLLNGEETAIGGLFFNQEIIVRLGIPILKDLPWWVFGLKYLFGYDSKEIIKKEIIILIKADILPSLKERISRKKDDQKLKSEIKLRSDEMKNYMNQSEKDEELKKAEEK